MFELIGIIVVAWFCFIVIRGFFKASSRVRSQEYGKEARYIAINELEVPESFYNYSIVNDMENIKEAALVLRETSKEHKDLSWPRLLASTIHGGYYFDCQQYEIGNPVSQQRLDSLNISPDEIYYQLNKHR